MSASSSRVCRRGRVVYRALIWHATRAAATSRPDPLPSTGGGGGGCSGTGHRGGGRPTPPTRRRNKTGLADQHTPCAHAWWGQAVVKEFASGVVMRSRGVWTKQEAWKSPAWGKGSSKLCVVRPSSRTAQGITRWRFHFNPRERIWVNLRWRRQTKYAKSLSHPSPTSPRSVQAHLCNESCLPCDPP